MRQPQKIWFAAGIIAFLIIGIFAFVMRSVAARHLNLPALEAQFAQFTGIPIRVQRVHLRWNGNVILDGVHAGKEGAEFLSSREAQVKISLLSLPAGKIKIRGVELASPALTLNKSVLDSLAKLFKKHVAKSQAFPVSFSRGRFAYMTPSGKVLTLNNISGNFALGLEKTSVALHFKDEGGGVYDVGGYYRSHDLNFTGKVRKIAMSEVFIPLGINPIPELQGKTDGNFTLSGNFGALQLVSDFSADSGLFKCAGNLTLSLPSAGPPRHYLSGKLIANSGAIEGIGQFKSFHIDFLEPENSFVFQNGTLEFADEKILVSGTIDQRHVITVHFSSPSFNPFSLPNFSGWGVDAEPGAFEGVASGQFPHLRLTTKGTFPHLSVGGKKWNRTSVDLQAAVSSGTAHFDKFLVTPNGIPLSLSGHASWDNVHNLHFYFADVNASNFAKLFGLYGKLEPLHVILGGAVDYDKAKRQWTGALRSEAGMIAGLPFNRFSGGFSYQEKQSVQVTGDFESEGRKAVVDGQWKNGKGKFNLNASRFPLTQIPFLGNAWKGFRGIADIHAHYSTDPGSENQIDFSIPHPTYNGDALPQLTGTIYVKGNAMRVSPLKILGVGSELDVTGIYDSGSRQESMTARLSGQDLQSLFRLVHAGLPPFRGLPFGNLEVSGVYPRLSVKFSGTVKNLYFSNFFFEEGKLKLSGTLPNAESFQFQTDKFSLSQISFLQKFMPALNGTGTLSASKDAAGKDVSIAFQIPKTMLKEKPLGPMEGSLAYHGETVMVKELSLPISIPPLSVRGSFDLKGGGINLSSALNGQQVKDLAGVFGVSTSQMNGRLYGNMKLYGPLSHAKLDFSGEGRELKLAGDDIGDARLSLHVSKQADGFTTQAAVDDISVSKISMLQKNFPGMSGRLALKATITGEGTSGFVFLLKNSSWKGKRFPDLEGVVVKQNQIAKFTSLDIQGLTPPIHAQGQVNTATHSYSFSANLDGQKASDLLRVLGQSISGFDARFRGPFQLSGTEEGMEARFSGTASEMVFHALSLGKGHVELSARSDPSKHFLVRLAANNIPVGNIAVVASRFPGISGSVNLSAQYNTSAPQEASLDFSLINARRAGIDFPKLNGHASWKAPILQIAPLIASNMNPPLTMRGSVDSERSTTAMSGRLEGQSIKDLMMLTGGATSEINGKLFGPLEISGPSSALRIQFEGQVTNLSYRGVQLGPGNLSLAVTKAAVSGRLDLERPVSFDPNGSLLGEVLQRVPGVGGFLNQVAARVVITGVTIHGSPQHPEITPILRRAAGTQTNTAQPPQQQAPSQQQQPNPVNILEQILKNVH